jgi:hypothetical protein
MDEKEVVQKMRAAVNECFYDLKQACADCRESLCAEGLADFLEDRMYDLNVKSTRALALSVARQYI